MKVKFRTQAYEGWHIFKTAYMKVDIDASKKETQITVTLIRQAVEFPGEDLKPSAFGELIIV